MKVIDRFRREWAWLSNFWHEPVLWRGVEFQCAEAAYQAAKFPRATWCRFEGLSGLAAKRLGNAMPLDQERWTVLRRVCVMRSVLRAKFTPGGECARLLLLTGEALLVEGNTWGDAFWGVCDGVGSNVLGKLLMDRRAELWMRA